MNDNTSEYLNTILKNGFILTILLPTRVTSHTCTLIDHINHQSRNSRIQILSGKLITDMSDHFANFITLHSKNKNIAVDRPMVKIFSDKNKSTFQNLLSTTNWENEMSDRNANMAVIIFSQKFTISYNESFPFVKLSRKGSKGKPWITTRLKQIIKQKYLYQKYIYNSTKENNQIYKIFKTKLRTLIRKAEADYNKESFNHNTQSMKQMGRELGNLLNISKKKSNNSISRIIVDNKILNNDKDIANALNTHFTQIGKNLAIKVVSQKPHFYETYLTDPVDDSLFLRPTSDEELLNEIN